MGIVKRQSVQSSVVTYIGVLIGYVNLILLFPKFLSPEELGLTRLLLSMATIFSQFALIGTSISLLRFFPFLEDKKSKHHGFFSFALLVSLIGFFFFTAIFLLLHNQVTSLFSGKSALFVDYYYYVFPLSFFLVVFELFFMYTRALFKTVVPTLIREVVLRLLQTAALLLLVSGLVHFQGFLLLFIGSYLIHLLAIMLYVGYLKQLFIFSKINFEGIVPVRQVMRYSLFIFAAAIAAFYTSNIDQIMLGALIGLSSNAVYSIAFFVGAIIQIPGRAMNQVAIPIVSEAWKENNIKKLQELYTQTALNQLIIGGFIFCIVWINTDLLLSLLPPIYQQAKWAIFIVGMGKLFDSATGMNGEILMVSKHSKAILGTNVFLILVATVSNYLLIPVWGVCGSALATALSLFFYNMIRMVFLYYIYRIQPFNANTAKAFMLLIAVFAMYYLLPDSANMWVNGIYQSMIVTLLIVFSLIVFNISPEITASYLWAKKKAGF